jgi:phosphopantetheine adenylyltransferase
MKDEPITTEEKTLLQTLKNICKDNNLQVEFVMRVNEKGENTIFNMVVLNLDMRNHHTVNSIIKSINEQFDYYKEFELRTLKQNIKDNEQNII